MRNEYQHVHHLRRDLGPGSWVHTLEEKQTEGGGWLETRVGHVPEHLLHLLLKPLRKRWSFEVPIDPSPFVVCVLIPRLLGPFSNIVPSYSNPRSRLRAYGYKPNFLFVNGKRKRRWVFPFYIPNLHLRVYLSRVRRLYSLVPTLEPRRWFN